MTRLELKKALINVAAKLMHIKHSPRLGKEFTEDEKQHIKHLEEQLTMYKAQLPDLFKKSS